MSDFSMTNPFGIAPPPPEDFVATAGVPLQPGMPVASEETVVEALRTVYDPEIPVNIYELGLIYTIDISPENEVKIIMTLTAPGCPAAVTLPAEVQGKVKSIDGVTDARVDIVWEPPWDKDRMSEAAKLQLGIFD